MTRRTRQIYLAGIASLSLVMALLFLTLPSLRTNPKPPSDLRGMALWLSAHPGDWLTAGALSDQALDSSIARRRELWRTAYDLSDHLAPLRPNPAAAFVRGGLFHWYELGPADRQRVLAIAAPLLHNRQQFGSLLRPLFELTRDFAYLRRNAPQSEDALVALRDLAVTNGLFDQYRALRAEVRAERWKHFLSIRETEHTADLFDVLPEHLDAHDEPLVRAILEELDRKPFDSQQISPRVEDLALFAMRQGIQPLSALAPFVETPGALSNPTRARLAIALGKPSLASQVELTSADTRLPDWVPYQLERAVYEARSGDKSVAEAYLLRTIPMGIDDRVLSSAEEVATLKGDAANAARYHAQLLEAAKKRRVWSQTCGQDEVCMRAVTRQYVAEPDGVIRLNASVVQTDEVPPYLELFVDDALVAEGPVRGTTVFEAPAKRGLHRVEVRLANRLTRNGVQRRVRLS